MANTMLMQKFEGARRSLRERARDYVEGQLNPLNDRLARNAGDIRSEMQLALDETIFGMHPGGMESIPALAERLATRAAQARSEATARKLALDLADGNANVAFSTYTEAKISAATAHRASNRHNDVVQRPLESGLAQYVEGMFSPNLLPGMGKPKERLIDFIHTRMQRTSRQAGFLGRLFDADARREHAIAKEFSKLSGVPLRDTVGALMAGRSTATTLRRAVVTAEAREDEARSLWRSSSDTAGHRREEWHNALKATDAGALKRMTLAACIPGNSAELDGFRSIVQDRFRPDWVARQAEVDLLRNTILQASGKLERAQSLLVDAENITERTDKKAMVTFGQAALVNSLTLEMQSLESFLKPNEVGHLPPSNDHRATKPALPANVELYADNIIRLR